MMWVRSWNFEVFDQALGATKSFFDQPKAVDAITFMWKLIWTHKVMPVPAASTNKDQLFISKKAGLYHAASATRGLQATIGDQFTFRVEKQPKGPVPDGKIGMSNTYDFMGLNAKSKAQDQAWKVLVYFTVSAAGVGAIAADNPEDAEVRLGGRKNGEGPTSRLVARVSPRTRIAEGTEIQLVVDTRRLYFFDPETEAAI